jgi:hypothetical protein
VSRSWQILLGAGALILVFARPAPAQKRPHGLPAVDLKERVIWGSTCEGPDGLALSFGGEDQRAEDGRAHTRLRIKDDWQDIHGDLRSRNPLQKYHDRCRALAKRQKETTARVRHLYLEGLPAEVEAGRLKEVRPAQEQLTRDLAGLVEQLKEEAGRLKGYEADQARHALDSLLAPRESAGKSAARLMERLTPELIEELNSIQIALEKSAEYLDAEPPARALSPLVYDASVKGFVLFGGDHLDYLTNDTWIFHPAERKWTQRQPKTAPPPRAHHTLRAAGEGKILLSGGYTYSSNTDYMGGQYRDLDDGDWTYDLAANTWTGGKGVAAGMRVYRTGPFLPSYFLQGPRPDGAAFAARLRSLPANTWVMTAPPQLPQMNRDWGSAILDPERDLILRWSGGHCAHGGTDVLHFHLGSNRWELPFPVEFPLGQLYTNTEYPDGFNFNLRPWVTGHTYQNYGHDPISKKMIFTGQPRHSYIYDPDVGDWVSRAPKPKGMTYGNCFYTLTLCAAPKTLLAWTQEGNLFRFESEKGSWKEMEQSGGRLPGSVVDNSTLVYDSKRNRLLFARKGYGDKARYDGELHTFDLETEKVGKLSPAGRAAANAIPYLCQLRYDPEHDLVLAGATLPADDGGLRRTPAYDCAGNRWVSLRITGNDPNGKTGRNVSLGLVYDARRKLFWAVDTAGRVYVLRLDPGTADVRALE